ncbi:50S ribosomal protein L25 [bacterium]|nr:50S ribosomal protein L25 [bacterium]|tara:strand:- start:7740 stop:8414 length:675 start_codon:yes stop_codon:yes gene_type:complete
MPKLIAEKRDTNTKATVLRREGKLPAVFYGRKAKTTPISLEQGEFIKTWKDAGESTIIDLSYDGKEVNVLIHDVAIDPVKETPLHVDFYVVEADRPVEVHIPIEFDGDAPALKEEGASVVKVLYEIEIKGLPKELPQQVSVDLSSLKTVDDQIIAKDIKLPDGIELITNPDDVIASISVTVEKEEETPEFDASAVEVEKKGKDDKDGAGEKEGGEKSAEAEKKQ